jgi:putative transposase
MYDFVTDDIIAQAKNKDEDFLTALRKECLALMPRVINQALENEVNLHVQAGWHERCPGKRWDRRNGYYKRTLTSLGTQLTIRVPRVRNGSFRSSFLPSFKCRTPDFDEAVKAFYIGGLSTRETSATMHEALNHSVSQSTIATIVQEIDEQRKRFQTRLLDDDFIYLLLDGMHVRCMIDSPRNLTGVCNSESIEKVYVLVVRGLRADGSCETIDFSVMPSESEPSWEMLLRNLYTRGLQGKQIKAFVHDGSEGLRNAIATVYGTDAASQRCVCHKLRNVLDAVKDKKNENTIHKDFSEIYSAGSQEDAYNRLAQFEKTWGVREAASVRILRENFHLTLTFMNLPEEHRRWIITNNLVEREIRELRRRTRPMNTFMGLDHLYRAVFLSIVKSSTERKKKIPFSLWNTERRLPRSRSALKMSLHEKRREFFDTMLAM